jgi:flagellar hook capping protein FlgD/cohesin domain-containing protein
MAVVHQISSQVRRALTCARVIVTAFALLAVASAAHAVVHHVVLGTGYAAASAFTPTGAQAELGSGSWWKLLPGAKAETYISPDVTFGTPITVADIASIAYHTRNHANDSPLEFYLAIYTRGPGSPPYANGFYEQRLNAEPYLKTVQPYVPVIDDWSVWATDGGDPLTFTDHNNSGNAGFYGAPTLAQVQAGPIDWSTWPGNPSASTANPVPIDYASQPVLYLSFQTGSGWSAFDGYLDDITVTLTNGDSYIIDLEAAVDPLFVDDDWATAGVGSEVESGKFIGYNAFATIQDAVNAAVPGGTINVAGGSYVEQVVVDGKDVSILGAGRGTTIVYSPSILSASFTTSDVNKPVVFIQNTPNVIVRDLTVDGVGRGDTNFRMQGVAYWNAGGQLLDCDVTRVRNKGLTSSQAGVCVFGGTNTGAFSLEVGGTGMSDFQLDGAVFTGAGYSVNVHDCAVKSAPTSVIVQHGIEIADGAGGSVTRCNVQGVSFTGFELAASGLFCVSAGPVNVTDCQINQCQIGAYFIDTNGQLIRPVITAPGSGAPPPPPPPKLKAVVGPFGVRTLNSEGVVAQSRTGEVGDGRAAAQTYDAGTRAARSLASATVPIPFTVTIEGGCITGPGLKGKGATGEGVEAFTEGEGLVVNMSHVEITNWGVGIRADGTVAGPTVNAHHNAITPNLVGYSAGLGSHTAELNWWGAAGGPGVGGVNTVSGPVDYTPWLRAGTDNIKGCGFLPPADNLITPEPPASCITPANPCIQVPVQIHRSTADDLRAFSIDVQLSDELTLCAPVDEGSYLSNVGATQFQVLSNGGGSYTIDCSILGMPCGATAASGTLFTLNLGSLLPHATGSVTISSVILRDCANGAVVATPGAPAAVNVDNAGPTAIAALSAVQTHNGNDADGTTQIEVTWPALADGETVLLYRKGFGFYPEYDDAGGVAPAVPSYPPADWTLAATVANTSGFADEPPTRDFWYYVAFVSDACGQVSPVSNRTDGTLNYHLGDVEPVAGLLRGDNLVSTSDVSDLGIHYGISLALDDPLNYLDVGPTTNFSTDARPTTDNRVQFEDLMMFAINYGQVSTPALAAKPAGKAGPDELGIAVPELPAVGQAFAVGVELSTAGTVKGVSVQLAYDPAIVEPAGVEAGELLTAQHAPSVVLSSQAGNVDAALLGRGEVISGRGEVARALFRVKAPGDAAFRVASMLARDKDNRVIALGVGSTPAGNTLPARTALGPASPNPFSRETSIELALRHECEVSLEVYDLSGRRVAQVMHGIQPAGVRLVTWDGRMQGGVRMAPGVYLMRLEADGQRQTRRVLLVP